MPDEEQLSGGNVTPVVRIGRTVRRQPGPWTPTVHAFLRHLERVGFPAAPRVLGVDEHRREILSYLPGEAGNYPLPEELWSDTVLVRAARLLRVFHDATLDFTPPPDAVWQFGARQPAEVICHGDYAPHNLIFQGQQIVGMIDFDTAGPGPRSWDVAYAAYRFVPLTHPGNPSGTTTLAEQQRRLRLLIDAYELPAPDRAHLVATVRERLVVMADLIRSRAAAVTVSSPNTWPRGMSTSTTPTSRTSPGTRQRSRPLSSDPRPCAVSGTSESRYRTLAGHPLDRDDAHAA
jgi:hypothetical protein